MGQYVKILPKTPGINTELTEFQSQMGFTDGDLVRFRNTFPEKLGGWRARDGSSSALSGTCRSIFSHVTQLGQDFALYGTNTHVFAEQGQAFYDVTPYRTAQATLTNPFTTGSIGSSVITVTDTAHGETDTDPLSRVIISGITSGTIDGVTIATGEYFVDVADANSYTITPVPGGTGSITGTATSGSVSGGGTVLLRYLILNGPDDSTLGYGFGAGTYGTSTWNTIRSTAVAKDTRVWSFDAWGEDVIGSVGNGVDTIYYFDATNITARGQTLASYVTTLGLSSSEIPLKVGQVMVSTPDRHLCVFGSIPQGGSDYDPMTIKWCAQESLTEWNAIQDLNTAGDIILGTGVTINSVGKGRGQLLVWTNEDIYSMQFIGGDFTFSFQQLGTRSGSISVKSATTVEGKAYWLGQDNFYVYDGAVKILPCPVRNRIFGSKPPEATSFDTINPVQYQKVFACQVKKYNEIWWFYAADVTDVATGNITVAEDINRYVIYNYEENVWSVGKSLVRTAWEDANIFTNPIATDLDSDVWDQETGYNDGNNAMNSYIQTGYFNGDENGNNLFFIDRVIPDTIFTEGTTMQFEIKSRRYPNDTITTKGPYDITSSTNKLDLRSRGRAFQCKFSSAVIDTQWRLGTWRARGQPDGAR